MLREEVEDDPQPCEHPATRCTFSRVGWSPSSASGSSSEQPSRPGERCAPPSRRIWTISRRAVLQLCRWRGVAVDIPIDAVRWPRRLVWLEGDVEGAPIVFLFEFNRAGKYFFRSSWPARTRPPWRPRAHKSGETPRAASSKERRRRFSPTRRRTGPSPKARSTTGAASTRRQVSSHEFESPGGAQEHTWSQPEAGLRIEYLRAVRSRPASTTAGSVSTAGGRPERSFALAPGPRPGRRCSPGETCSRGFVAEKVPTESRPAPSDLPQSHRLSRRRRVPARRARL